METEDNATTCKHNIIITTTSIKRYLLNVMSEQESLIKKDLSYQLQTPQKQKNVYNVIRIKQQLMQ